MAMAERVLLWLIVSVVIGYAIYRETRPPVLPLRAWELVCYQAPHAKLNERILKGLHQAKVHPGFKDWQPDVAWVNEQCQVLGLGGD